MDKLHQKHRQAYEYAESTPSHIDNAILEFLDTLTGGLQNFLTDPFCFLGSVTGRAAALGIYDRWINPNLPESLRRNTPMGESLHDHFAKGTTKPEYYQSVSGSGSDSYSDMEDMESDEEYE